MFKASDDDFQRVLLQFGDKEKKYLESKYKVDLSKYKTKDTKVTDAQQEEDASKYVDIQKLIEEQERLDAIILNTS